MTITESANQQNDDYKSDIRWLAACGPLPDADTLAEPFLKAIGDLAVAFDERATVIANGIHHGDLFEEAEQHVAIANRVAMLVGVTVERHTPQRRPRIGCPRHHPRDLLNIRRREPASRCDAAPYDLRRLTRGVTSTQSLRPR